MEWRFVSFVGLAGTAILALAPDARAGGFEGDIVPRLQGSLIINDGISDVDGSIASNVTVFQYTLGELVPYYTMDPGLQPLTTSGLPGSSFLGFNILGLLRSWDGTGTPVLVPDATGSQLELYFGQLTTFSSGTTAFQDGFVIQQLTSEGAGHRHLNAQLLGAPDPSGTILDSLGNPYDAPPNGIYAIPIEVTDSLTQTTNPPTYRSATTWLVYNNGLSSAQLDAASDTLLSPPPPYTATWNGSVGNWSDATRWSTNPTFPNNGTPSGATYNAVINAGVVTLDLNVTLAGLTLAGSPDAWTAKLDLKKNSLIVAAGINVPNQIRQAAALGAWAGTGGITSSSAAAATGSTATALAYATGTKFTAGNGQSTFAGRTFNPNDTLIMYTLAGDANMDQSVTFADFLQLQNNYNRSGTDWEQGDWNYDNSTTFADFLILQNNYNKTLTPANLAAAIPEPGSLAILGLGATLLLRRRFTGTADTPRAAPLPDS